MLRFTVSIRWIACCLRKGILVHFPTRKINDLSSLGNDKSTYDKSFRTTEASVSHDFVGRCTVITRGIASIRYIFGYILSNVIPVKLPIHYKTPKITAQHSRCHTLEVSLLR